MRTSIIVLCYNSLEETTRPCLESIVKNTPVGDYELIIIDNASSDGTPEYLQEFARLHTNIRIQLNDINKGYAGGNNDGIALANNEYIILLNNDTLVPAGWLDKLLFLFQNHPNIGLIGPVTNSAGNEQRIELDRLNEKNYEDISGEYIKRQAGVWFETEKLGFFCVAIRSSVVKKIGVLDEKFGIGMFEDDDYCIRAKKAGFNLAIAEDCFVFHKGSVSFGKLAVENYRRLFEKNRQYFYEKHQEAWLFSDIAFSYLECFERNLRTYVNNNLYINPSIERILVRIKNLNHLLVQIRRTEVDSQKLSKNINGSAISRRAKWATRRFNFSRNVIHGTNNERLRYFRVILNGVKRRIGLNSVLIDEREILNQLNALRVAAQGKKIIVFTATIDFCYMRQRPQGLANAFSKAGYFVIYSTLCRQGDRVNIAHKISNDLYLVNEMHIHFLRHLFSPNNIVLYCMWPNNIKYIALLPHSFLIYDYMDDLSLLNFSSADLDKWHSAMIKNADLITVSASKLFDELSPQARSKAILINNATSNEFIQKLKEFSDIPDKLKDIGDAWIFGYYGAIAEWMDFDLLRDLAEEFPDAFLVLIGPVSPSVHDKLMQLLRSNHNILAIPALHQSELVPYLKRFNACMIPFIKNHITDSVSPVKLFEYCAANKPVISTDIEECSKYPIIKVAKSTKKYLQYAKSIMDGEHTQSYEIAVDFAEQNTWESRVFQILNRIT